jgi:hypothetical protein
MEIKIGAAPPPNAPNLPAIRARTCYLRDLMTAIASAAIYRQRLQRTQHGYNTLCKPLIQRREFVTHGYDIRYSKRGAASPVRFTPWPVHR